MPRCRLLPLFLFLISPLALADNINCIESPVSSILNTTCKIGPLTFTFGDLSGGYHTDAPGRQELNVDDFSFAPFFGDPDYGFTVTVNSGAKAITATSAGYAIAGASLLFTVATTDGNRSIYSGGSCR